MSKYISVFTRILCFIKLSNIKKKDFILFRTWAWEERRSLNLGVLA